MGLTEEHAFCFHNADTALTGTCLHECVSEPMNLVLSSDFGFKPVNINISQCNVIFTEVLLITLKTLPLLITAKKKIRFFLV
jgi:hypothetical protein